jgi:hypothetical protein
VSSSSNNAPSSEAEPVEIRLNNQYQLELNSSGFINNNLLYYCWFSLTYIVLFNMNPESNPFCNEWASELFCQRNDALLLRNVLEEFKFKIVQDWNVQRKLLHQATKNNYALYHSYRLLKNNPNGDVLFQLLCQQSVDGKANQNDNSVQEVLSVIQNHLYYKVTTAVK